MHSIGRFGSPWTVETARAEALHLLGILSSGVDPFTQSLSSETFGAEIERYRERKQTSLKPRSLVEVQRNLRKHSAPLHKLRLADIDRRTIAVLLGQVETISGPVARRRSSLSTFWAWAIQEGLTDEANPVQGTGKADEAASRDRVLTQDELRKLWHSLGDDRFSDVVRLLLLTGQRRNEIGKLTWGEVDLARKSIMLPAERVKNSRNHEVPLSRQALAIIERQPRRTDFVFGGRGQWGWAEAKAKLDQRVAIAPFRLHDLRRTAATGMAELGILPHVIEQALNHVSGAKAGVAGVYNRSKMTDAVREGLQKWADHLDHLTASSRSCDLVWRRMSARRQFRLNAAIDRHILNCLARRWRDRS